MARARTETPAEAPEQDGEAAKEAPEGSSPREAEASGERLLGARTIHERMVAILAALPALEKASENKQQGFMYRSHDDVLNALNPLLAEHGVFVVPTVLDRTTDKRQTQRNSIMYEVNLHVLYTFYGPAGDYVQASAWGEGTDMGDKSTNKAMTMAFKNVLAQAFAVSTQEAQRYDADASTPEETVAAPKPEAPVDDGPTSNRAQRLRGRIGELCGALDVQTQQQEAGTWLAKTKAGIQLAFEVEYEQADPRILEEVGKALKAMQEGGITEAPEQLDFAVPF